MERERERERERDREREREGERGQPLAKANGQEHQIALHVRHLQT